MKIGIIGHFKSGKTTVFNALTGGRALTDKYIQTHQEPHLGIVQVLDERVTKLSEIYKPKKTIYAQLEYHDFPPLFQHQSENEVNSSLIAEAKKMEGYAVILRAYKDEEADELYGRIDPLKDLGILEDELIIHDQIIAEKRLEKIELSYKRGIKTPALQIEEKALQTIVSNLQSNIPIRKIQLSIDELKATKGFQFMSQKPLMAILNCSEDNYLEVSGILQEIANKGYLVDVIAGKFEEELSRMEPEDALLFMEDIGIKESARERLTRLCYQLMGYISFFTVGEDEVRAWTIEKGDNAVTAAGKIHSDLARGFIRAECFAYDDLLRYGSEKVLKEKGLFKLEGKEYIVKDGDILSIRFNV